MASKIVTPRIRISLEGHELCDARITQAIGIAETIDFILNDRIEHPDDGVRLGDRTLSRLVWALVELLQQAGDAITIK